MTVLNFLTIVTACLSVVEGAAISLRSLSFDYSSQKVRGVNLGGWLVTEPFIKPSLYAQWANGGGVVDEFTFCRALGPTEATRRLSAHWNSWITQGDFQQIAASGFNHVRIPIGYWAVEKLSGDPYVQGQLAILDNAIGWARGAGLKVIIDLHGAPGSQNGFDNSGHYGAVNWETGNTVSQTLTALKTLVSRYTKQSDVVTAIELLNEPLGPVLNQATIKQFYLDGYSVVRAANKDTAVTIHDAFFDIDSYWNGFMGPSSGKTHVILDTHIYQIFSNGEVSRTPAQHISNACSNAAKLRATDKWVIVGEWTAAQTDCAKWLNGLGKGARYDGTFAGGPKYGSCTGSKYAGSAGGLSATDKVNLRKFVEAQMDAYEAHTGWVFWTWKTESAPEWSAKDLIAAGLFPQPLTAREYPGQCR